MALKNVVRILVSSVVVFSLVSAASVANARNTRHLFSIEDAMKRGPVHKLDPNIQLIFGNDGPVSEQSYGLWKTNKKTNAFNKTDEDACRWVFFSALLSLQARARKEGGNAVVGITSVTSDFRTTSETEYMCAAGDVIAGVALEGTVVRIAN